MKITAEESERNANELSRQITRDQTNRPPLEPDHD